MPHVFHKSTCGMGKVRPWKAPQKSRRACYNSQHHSPARSYPPRCKSHRGTSNIAVGKIRSSWDQRLQQRAERAAVLAAQKAVDEEIRTQKRVRLAWRLSACQQCLRSILCPNLSAGGARGERGKGEEEGGKHGEGPTVPSGALRLGRSSVGTFIRSARLHSFSMTGRARCWSETS